MLRRAAVLFFLVIALFLFGAGEAFSDQNASITNSGETLYYLLTVPPAINVNPSSLDFGLVTVGSSGSLSITVTNTGAGQLNVGAILSPGAPYSISADSCSAGAFGQNGTCVTTVQFTPTVDGTFPSSITIPSNDPNTPQVTVPISGTSQGAIITASPNPLDFGSVGVGGFSTLSVTVQNTGNINLTFGTIGTPAAPFSNVGGTCVNGGTLTPTQTCTISIKYSPSSVGTFNSNFIITSNAYNAGSYTVNLTGTAVASPQISITPNPVSFGSETIGSNNSTTVTVQNIGSANLVLGSPAITVPFLPLQYRLNHLH